GLAALDSTVVPWPGSKAMLSRLVVFSAIVPPLRPGPSEPKTCSWRRTGSSTTCGRVGRSPTVHSGWTRQTPASTRPSSPTRRAVVAGDQRAYRQLDRRAPRRDVRSRAVRHLDLVVDDGQRVGRVAVVRPRGPETAGSVAVEDRRLDAVGRQRDRADVARVGL